MGRCLRPRHRHPPSPPSSRRHHCGASLAARVGSRTTLTISPTHTSAIIATHRPARLSTDHRHRLPTTDSSLLFSVPLFFVLCSREGTPMPDYQPIDLGSLCNAGVAAYGDAKPPPTGQASLHGLPFSIGGAAPDPARCFVGLGPGAAEGAVVVPVGATARHVIFAHALLDSRLLEGETVGVAVAHYSIRYADGTTERVPIRERFEIGAIPMWWSAFPFLAVPDRQDSMAPRYQGEWGEAGYRQTEADQGWPSHYYLWDWANPRPEQPIESIALEPAGRRVVLAAITLGQRDEQPLRRMPKRAAPDHAAAPRGRQQALRPGGGGRSRRGHLPLRPARAARRRVPGRPDAGLRPAGQQKQQPGLRRGGGHPLGHRHGEERRGDAGGGALGRAPAAGRGRDAARQARDRRQRPQLGARHRAGRGDRPARALPGAFPLARWPALPAAWPPQPRQLEPRHLAYRRGRRCAAGPDQLRLYRRRVPGLAAARRGDRGCGARLRVPAAARPADDRAGPAGADDCSSSAGPI